MTTIAPETELVPATEPTAAEPTAAEPIIVDGYLVDPDTGEVLGVADLPTPAFVVDSQDAAEWVLSKMLAAESDVASLETHAEVLRAKSILANYDAIKKEKARRITYLHNRFDAELGHWAKSQLEGKKTKTLKLVLGSIALRTVKGGLRVTDRDAALEWAERNFEDAIKYTSEFQISRVPDEVKARLAHRIQVVDPELDPIALRAFEITPDVEKVDVKTGVAS